MTGQIILFATLLLPLVLGLAFRVGTSHLFFSIMAGELLARYFAHDVESLAEKNINQSSNLPIGELLLILVPLFLTAILLKGTLPKSKLILHIIPLIVTGVVLSAFILPLLPVELQLEIASSRLGDYLLNLNRVIIGVVVGLQLIALWLFNRSHEGHSKHH